jgi:hypothetical protein
VQGGSDISGTLSKPHFYIKNTYILLIILRKCPQLFVKEETITNRHVPAKVNQ